MSGGKRWFWGATVTCLVALIVGLSVSEEADVAAPATSSEPTPLRLSWVLGKTYGYRLDLEGHQETQVLDLDGTSPGRRLEVDTHVAGHLKLTPLARRDGKTTLAIRLDDLRHFSVTLGGRPVIARDKAEAMFASHEARLVLADDGSVAGLVFASAAPELFIGTVRMIASALQMRLSGSATPRWSETEGTLTGTFDVAYTRRACPKGHCLTRVPLRLISAPQFAWLKSSFKQTVSGRADIVLADAGHLIAVVGTQRHTARTAAQGELLRVNNIFEMQLAEITEAIATQTLINPVRATLRTLHQRTDSRTARSALTQRVDGLTWEALRAGVWATAMIPQGKTRSRWFWQATGLLKLRPELCARLVDLFFEEGLDEAAQHAILDLLATAGHPVAQDTMRTILSRPEARESRIKYARLVQRFSFVREPTPESARFLARDYAGWTGAAKTGAAFAIGTVVRRLDDPTHDALRRELNQTLIRDLDAAERDLDKALILKALGNAGQSGNITHVARFAKDSSPFVRAASALALVRTQSDASEEILFDLIGDTSEVQRQALTVLKRYTFDEPRRHRLAKMVLSGTVTASNYRHALPLVAQIEDRPTRDAVIRYMKAHALPDRPFVARLQRLLSEPGA